ncbi:MAG: CHC2 zinc finger domain-containing protein, partial [Candidatus Eremiobacterota bacterium]
MKQIPRETILEISAKLDSLALMGRYLKLRQSGKNYVALCPFHNERTPSFNFSQEKGVWHCHGCQQGGDIIQFFMKIEGLTFPQAVQRLGAECGVPVEFDEGDQEARSERERMLDLLERTASFYQEYLKRSPVAEEARRYLQQRGLQPE